MSGDGSPGGPSKANAKGKGRVGVWVDRTARAVTFPPIQGGVEKAKRRMLQQINACERARSL